MPANWLLLPWILASMGVLQAQTATDAVLHNFGDFPNGALPYGTPIRSSSGDLYGATYEGGAAFMGAVFEMSATGKYKVLYSFKGGADGANPYAGVTLEPAGNFYGTTHNGGASGLGTVYEVTPSGQETVLYSFAGGADGANPYAGVALDSAGNLYGTTYYGGTANAGAVYKLTPSGQEAILYSFTGGDDGSNPYASVTLDPAGDLYGTTLWGGSYGEGTVYKLNMRGQETVLHTFSGGNDGGSPYANVILDPAGDLYGTASGGVGGALFEVSAAGEYRELYQFLGVGPQRPASGLVRDAAGSLYGATSGGGSHAVGVVYKLDASGAYTTLYQFPGGTGYWLYTNTPNPGVVLDAEGNVYGATPYAGAAGMVYKVTSSGQEKTLYSFAGAAGGTDPGEVLLSKAGEIYGTTSGGGSANAGVVYKMSVTGQEAVLHSFAGGSDGAHPSGGLAVDSAGNGGGRRHGERGGSV